MTSILKKRKSIQAKINELEEQLQSLRESCTHPNVVKTHKADTGNYDPSTDCYWTEFKCPDCGKFWVKEGSV
jgi:hypothetical protein